MPKRIERINQQIKKEISQAILKEIEFPPDVLVTITRVETFTNLSKAKVFVSVMPEKESLKILAILNKRIYSLQKQVNKRFKIRPVPQIIFTGEEKTKEAGRIEELLEKLKNGEK